MSNNQINPVESQVKLALDVAELVERVPALQRSAAEFNYNESGGLVLVLPRHPAVSDFLAELAKTEWPEGVDLKTARRRLRAASNSYQTRVTMRASGACPDDGRHSVFERFVSLSAILIARADASHWHRVVSELEHIARIKQHNARTVTRHKLKRLGLGLGY